MNSFYIDFTSCNHSHVQVIWGRGRFVAVV